MIQELESATLVKCKLSCIVCLCWQRKKSKHYGFGSIPERANVSHYQSLNVVRRSTYIELGLGVVERQSCNPVSRRQLGFDYLENGTPCYYDC